MVQTLSRYIAEGDFLECDEAIALDIIHGLSSYFVYDRGLDTE